MIQFTDREHTIIIDCLAAMQDSIMGPTPTIDTALAKMESFAVPHNYGFSVIPNKDQ